MVTILDDASEGLAAIENAIRGHEIEIRRADAVEPIERLYVFAGWTLDETARDLVSPAGRRVDLTSSEFDLLMAFLRQPGQALSRDALLGVLRGREWTYFDRSIDTLGGATAQEAGRRRRSASAGSFGARRRLCVLRRRLEAVRPRTVCRCLEAVRNKTVRRRLDAARYGTVRRRLRPRRPRGAARTERAACRRQADRHAAPIAHPLPLNPINLARLLPR